MRILEPFAGYRMASGHFIYHIAFFIGSFWVDTNGLTGIDNINTKAFITLRWGHAITFMLSLVSIYCDRQELVTKSSKDLSALEQANARSNQLLNLFAKFCDNAAVFIYQFAVFYAQWSLFTIGVELANDCFDGNRDDSQLYECLNQLSGVTLWLAIETVCFYVYMFSNVIFIVKHQVVSEWTRPKYCDLEELSQDFLVY